MNRILVSGGLFALLFVTSQTGLAQKPNPPDAATTAKPSAPPIVVATEEDAKTTPIRLQISITRYQGEKKISSMPYTISTSARTGRFSPPQRASFRMGAQVPIASASPDGKPQSYNYRDVGIAIDVSGQTIIEPGLYKFDIVVNDSSVYPSNQIPGAQAAAQAPIFRNFSTNGTLILRDAQTGQLTSAADPISGELMRVDVTLNVSK